MDGRKRLQSKHLSDLGILTVIAAISSSKKSADPSVTAPRVRLQELEEVMPNIPRKLLLAKMRKMERNFRVEIVGHADRSRYVISVGGYLFLQDSLKPFNLRAKYAKESRERGY